MSLISRTNVLDLETETAVTVTGEVSFENNQGDNFLAVSSSFLTLECGKCIVTIVYCMTREAVSSSFPLS